MAGYFSSKSYRNSGLQLTTVSQTLVTSRYYSVVNANEHREVSLRQLSFALPPLGGIVIGPVPPPKKGVMFSLRSVCLSVCLILMKLCTVVWNPKSKNEFVGSQYPTTPSPVFPQPKFSPYYCRWITEKVVNRF